MVSRDDKEDLRAKFQFAPSFSSDRFTGCLFIKLIFFPISGVFGYVILYSFKFGIVADNMVVEKGLPCKIGVGFMYFKRTTKIVLPIVLIDLIAFGNFQFCQNIAHGLPCI
jgi:hypothetical protein